MKKFLKLCLMFLIFLNVAVFAQGISNPQDNCIKTYNMPADTLYMSTFSALAQLGYPVQEIQSQSGYIAFKDKIYGVLYLATITKDGTGSQIKIMPADSNFSRGFSVQESVFKTLDEEVPFILQPAE
jgi:hypothetical protein